MDLTSRHQHDLLFLNINRAINEIYIFKCLQTEDVHMIFSYDHYLSSSTN